MEAAKSVAAVLRNAGYVALFAGGMVRDMILKRPFSDIDIATSARPEEVEALFGESKAVGKSFGVVLVRNGGHEFEVATFRSDGEYRDGRRPSEVTFCGAEEDARRRDFTCNALFMDPETSALIDYVGGLDDIQHGVLRFVGAPADRIAEDRLRILRAVRLSNDLQFRYDPKTWEALSDNGGSVTSLSGERIRDELNRMLVGEHPLGCLHDLWLFGILDVILPEVTALRGVEQSPVFHAEGDAFAHTMLTVGCLPRNPSVLAAWGTLLHDIGKGLCNEDGDARFHGHEEHGAKMAEAIMGRLRFSNEETEHVVSLVRDHMMRLNYARMRKATKRKWFRKPHMEDLFTVMEADIRGSSVPTEEWETLQAMRRDWEWETTRPDLPAPLATGYDVMDLGVKPGPTIGRLLAELRDLQLDEVLTTREDGLEWLRRQTCAPIA